MKIIHVVWSLKFGGIETMLVNLANAQVDLNQDVAVVIINDNCDEKLLSSFNSNVKIIKLHKKLGSKNPFFIFKLNYLLLKLGPDVIHLHFSNIISLLLPSFRKKILFTLHSMPFGEIGKRRGIYKFLPFLNIKNRGGNVKDIDKVKVISISNAVQIALKEKYSVGSTVICNGIITKNFSQREPHLHLDPDIFKIVQVGRLEHEPKGQDLLINAVANLPNNVYVDFIGDGPSKEFLQKLVEDLKVEDKVTFMGSKDSKYIQRNLCNYDLLVQPSRREGFGLTVAEAMISKVPVLVSSGQGAAEVTENDRYGFVFELGNVSDLEDKIKIIINNYQKAQDKVGAAFEHVVSLYDINTTAENYLKMYEKIVQGRKKLF